VAATVAVESKNRYRTKPLSHPSKVLVQDVPEWPNDMCPYAILGRAAAAIH